VVRACIGATDPVHQPWSRTLFWLLHSGRPRMAKAVDFIRCRTSAKPALSNSVRNDRSGAENRSLIGTQPRPTPDIRHVGMPSRKQSLDLTSHAGKMNRQSRGIARPEYTVRLFPANSKPSNGCLSFPAVDSMGIFRYCSFRAGGSVDMGVIAIDVFVAEHAVLANSSLE
jgi:hypothetical protein